MLKFREALRGLTRQTNARSGPKTAHMIDGLWCDVHGVYVRGWAHAGEQKVEELHLRSEDRIQKIAYSIDRPDVRKFYPNMLSDLCGFHAYLECPPFRPVHLGIRTAEGLAELPIEPLAPDHPQNQWPRGKDFSLDWFISEMKKVRGVVVEIGARTVSPGATLRASQFSPECRFIGVDIHAAEGVDVVADAHFLSEAIAPGSVDGIFSSSVMEHIAVPWLVAAQINKVLRVGGYTMHELPQAFPVHETPNDFWRMSDEGLKVLFGEATGFEVVESGMSVPCQLMFPPEKRQGPFLETPLFPAMASSYIIARKKFDLPDGAVSWPVTKQGLEMQSILYPRH